MQDIVWVGLALAFFLFSGWFVAFAERLMPHVRPQADESADDHEVRA